uniref:Mitochondrial inner membrane protein COX18 n=1 Tax=Heterorhabditis bacteriophora TaxID=37862 RepID=A0A1I7X7I7_HETBA
MRCRCNVLYLTIKILQVASFRQLRRNSSVSSVPSWADPILRSFSEDFITQGIQFGIESIHGLGLPWESAFLVSGLILRLGTAPLYFYSEKLIAKHINARNFFTQKITEKFSEKYDLKIIKTRDNKEFSLNMDNPNVDLNVVQKMFASKVKQCLFEHRLHLGRILALKFLPIPLWINSSFALRNIINADFHPSMSGALWIPDLLSTDPYGILPLSVGVVSAVSFMAVRHGYYPVIQKTWVHTAGEVLQGALPVISVCILLNLPAIISLYWLLVSSLGFIQIMMVRHPYFKKLFGIPRLSSDTKTPLRDLFMGSRK